jgi:hypothetical protein
MVNVNQHTAQFHREPLLTLSKYRRKGANILFGQFLVHDSGGGDDTSDDTSDGIVWIEAGMTVVAFRRR